MTLTTHSLGQDRLGSGSSEIWLPAWPPRTIAVLATAAEGPPTIPVSAPVRVDDYAILLSLGAGHGCPWTGPSFRRRTRTVGG
jgi:hypothetical protein